MTIQLADTTRNARIAAIETDLGTSPVMEIRSGSQPANVATADSGTLGVSITLPADWLAAPSGGAASKSGTWTANASAAITAGYFNMKTSGAVKKLQGSCGIGTGDLQFDNTSIASGQPVTINTFTLTDGNA